MVSASNRPTTTMSMLVSTSFVPISICCPLIPVCGSNLLLSQVHLPSCISRVESVALFVKLFENTQDISMYEGFFATDDLNNNMRGYYYLSLQNSIFESIRFSIWIYWLAFRVFKYLFI